jgi:hypothetical protein
MKKIIEAVKGLTPRSFQSFLKDAQVVRNVVPFEDCTFSAPHSPDSSSVCPEEGDLQDLHSAMENQLSLLFS